MHLILPVRMWRISKDPKLCGMQIPKCLKHCCSARSRIKRKKLEKNIIRSDSGLKKFGIIELAIKVGLEKKTLVSAIVGDTTSVYI